MAETFSTAYYEAHGISTCPNGDKLRSDELGLFCMVEGDRVAAELINGKVTLKPEAPKLEPKPDKSAAGGK